MPRGNPQSSSRDNKDKIIISIWRPVLIIDSTHKLFSVQWKFIWVRTQTPTLNPCQYALLPSGVNPIHINVYKSIVVFPSRLYVQPTVVYAYRG